MQLIQREWDTSFWGVAVYDAILRDETNNGVHPLSDRTEDFNETCIKEPYLIQALVSQDDLRGSAELSTAGFRIAERKVTLVKVPDHPGDSVSSFVFHDVCEKDLESRKMEFGPMFSKVSRFAIFGREKVAEFYYLWLQKSFRGAFDDACVGVYDEDGLCGFITYKIRGNSLVIGLLGVFEACQGRGYGKQLLEDVNRIASEARCDRIFVSTQGTNRRALATYRASGFLVERIDVWYYKCSGLDYSPADHF